MKLSDIMVGDAIVPELKATTRDAAVAELVESLAEAGIYRKRALKT